MSTPLTHRRAAAAADVCHVLDEDEELAEALPVELREQAARECLARAVTIPAGIWEGVRGAAPGGIGLLVMRGLLIRTVGIDGRCGAELLGGGDLLRPWQGEDFPLTLSVTAAWRVIAPVRAAVLDEPFARRAARYPQISGGLVARALRRARNLSINMAIVHQARVEVRLHMLLWHLAGRWGKVCADHVSLPLRLTHHVLADLAAAQRPTVTSALSELTKQGRIRQTGEGWHLYGQPPGELLELTEAPVAVSDGAGRSSQAAVNGGGGEPSRVSHNGGSAAR